jgi:hypothetical protein
VAFVIVRADGAHAHPHLRAATYKLERSLGSKVLDTDSQVSFYKAMTGTALTKVTCARHLSRYRW